jgi:hypothetical protein
MASRRLLKLKHDRVEVGFLSASVNEDEGAHDAYWMMRVESPASTAEFRAHLIEGSCMSLSMVTRDGSQLRGEAFVSSISDCVDAATVVVLAGAGPLRRS